MMNIDLFRSMMSSMNMSEMIDDNLMMSMQKLDVSREGSEEKNE